MFAPAAAASHAPAGGAPVDRLPPALLRQLAQAGTARAFPANAVLISEGDVGESLYIVLSGRVKAYSASVSGREFVLGEFGPGEYLGELSLDGDRRSASVMTLEPTSCCVVPGSRLREFMAEHPDFAWHLTQKLIHMVRRLTGQVKSLALQDVYSRIAALLGSLSEPGDGVRVVPHKLTQQDIADRVGASREMVNRVMKELTKGGYVSFGQARQLMILKPLPANW